jgi:hypothetical protein
MNENIMEWAGVSGGRYINVRQMFSVCRTTGYVYVIEIIFFYCQGCVERRAVTGHDESNGCTSRFCCWTPHTHKTRWHSLGAHIIDEAFLVDTATATTTTMELWKVENSMLKSKFHTSTFPHRKICPKIF